MDPTLLTTMTELIKRFGLGGGIIVGGAYLLHRGVFRLGREVSAEKDAASYKAEAVALREALAKSERDLAEYKAIAMRSIQAAYAATKAVEKGAQQ